MGCTYKSRGVDNPVNTAVLQYIEDTPSNQRDPREIINMLGGFNLGRVDDTPIGIYLEIDPKNSIVIQAIDDLNEAAKMFFGVSNDLLKVSTGEYYEVDSSVLAQMSPISPEQYAQLKEVYAETQSKTEEGPPQVEEDPDPEQFEADDTTEEASNVEDDIDEVFQRKVNKDMVTEKIVHNLQLQIDRLERLLEETPNSRKKLNELRALQSQLRKVKEGSEKLDDYYNFIAYVGNLATRSKSLLQKIEVNYTRNYKTMTQAERADILKKISDLKETIDAFYNDSADLSVTTLLLKKIKAMPADQVKKDETLAKLASYIISMEETTEKYLETAIPIQADYLMSFAPIEINEQLDERIKTIRSSQRLSGLNTSDPQYRAINKNKLLSLEEKRKQILELNIKQLENQKIGREAIINELRETHKDASSFSTYADPLIYSSEPAIQMFALAVKEKMIEANDQTLNTVYNIKDEYKTFRDWKGVSEGNPDKLFEDVIEEVTMYVRDDKRKLVPIKVLSIVQPTDITKYNNNQKQAFDQFQAQYNFPEDPADLQEYFSGKNKMGNAYMEATSQWYLNNTDPIEGAYEYILNLERGIDSLYKQLMKAEEEGDLDRKLSVQIELNGLQYEYRKVSRNGIPIGKLTTPKLDLYRNSKFDNMPAEAKRFYDVVLEQYKSDQKKLGNSPMRRNSWDDFSYILPGIRTSTMDSLKENLGTDPLKKMLSDTFQYQETDTEFGEAVKANGEKLQVIPRYYTQLIESKLVSKNLMGSILMFNGMANRYKAKSEIVGVVNLMRSAIGERKITQMTSNGGPLLTRVAARLGYEIVPPVKGIETNTYKHLKGFIDTFYYGEEENQANTYILGTEISLNKTASFLSTGVAASTLSLNFLQATNQLIIDSLATAQEGMARQFYGNEELNWARSKLHFAGNSIAAIKDGISPKMVMQTKIAKMMETFDGFQDLGDDMMSRPTTTARKLAQVKSLFILQKGVEFITTAEKLLALSRTYKGKLKDASGKVILNEAGEEADLWDMLIEAPNGKLDIDPKVANFNKSQFIMKFHGLARRTNQLKGRSDKTLLEKYWWGKLITLFRRYYVPGIRKRFGHSQGGVHLDMELGQVTEGYYGTMFDIFQDMLFFVRSGDYGRAVKALFSAEGDVQKQQNMRRYLFETGGYVVLSALVAVIAGMMEDDDEEDTMLPHIMYQALRVQSELTAFINPVETFRIIENPTAAANLVRNIWGLGKATVNYAGNKVGVVADEEVYYQKRSGNWEKGDLKWTKEFLDVVPIFSGVSKSKSPEEALKYYLLNE